MIGSLQNSFFIGIFGSSKIYPDIRDVMPDDSSTEVKFELSSPSDEDLVAYLQANPRDRKLQGEIYDRFSRRIYFKCLSIVKNQETARDFSHDIFIRIFTNIHQFKGKSKFSLWVHSITYNYCLKQLGKKKIQAGSLDEYDDEITSEDTDSVLVTENRETQLKIVESSLSLLNAEERLLVSMKYVDNLKIHEMSKILKLEDSATKMRLKRTRDKLKKHIIKLSNL
ncbi:MAG: sigma-70 family RNA polymerase sigma factor [Saprospiraceae bacterium]|nr:sigma-70 family RNA polymerase sigma factor [Saprospiraceae bacterium]